MKTCILSLVFLLAVGIFPVAAQDAADVWKGVLVDWDCKQARSDEPCPVGPNSKRFALSVDGGIILRFDDHGNELTHQALRKAGAGGNVKAAVTGEREGRELRVKSVQIG